MVATDRVSLNCVLLQSSELIEVNDAYALADLPMRAQKSTDEFLSRSPRSQILGVVDLKSGGMNLIFV